jgi:hypothetical protein
MTKAMMKMRRVKNLQTTQWLKSVHANDATLSLRRTGKISNTVVKIVSTQVKQVFHQVKLTRNVPLSCSISSSLANINLISSWACNTCWCACVIVVVVVDDDDELVGDVVDSWCMDDETNWNTVKENNCWYQQSIGEYLNSETMQYLIKKLICFLLDREYPVEKMQFHWKWNIEFIWVALVVNEKWNELIARCTRFDEDSEFHLLSILQ